MNISFKKCGYIELVEARRTNFNVYAEEASPGCYWSWRRRSQVVHLPMLQLLSYLFETKAICDVSKKTADHCAASYNIPISTTNPNELFQNPDIDAIIILTSDEYHAPYSIAALQAGKSVLVE
jgi:predicted dehydrogenase